MNLMKHDKKPGGGEWVEQVPTRMCSAVLHAGSVIVPDPRDGEHIYSHGCYGHHLIDHNEIIYRKTMPDAIPDRNKFLRRLREPGRVWADKRIKNDQLYLSPWETLFLSLDMNILAVTEMKKELKPDELWLRMKALGGPAFLSKYTLYRYLRNNGWCVRSGMPFGCDYLIYRGNPSSYHAAAGVKIQSQMEPYFFIGFNRALTNTKKSFITVTVSVPENLDTSKHSCVESVEITMSASTTMFVERKLNSIKAEESGTVKRGVKRKAK